MKIEFFGKPLPVHFKCAKRHGKAAVNSRIFQNWLSQLDPRFQLARITITVVNFRGTAAAKNVLFVRLSVKLQTVKHDQVVELRGGTVAMMVNLICMDYNSVHTVLTRQARLASGDLNLAELPAGMIDGDSFVGAAARELEEELGLKFQAEELIDITHVSKDSRGIFLSPGLLDETCRFYLIEREVSPEELDAMRGKATGLREEGELITLEIVPLPDLVKATRDAKALIAYALFMHYQKEEAKKA